MNGKRVVVGALAGGVVWSVWSVIINFWILRPVYAAESGAGLILAEPRYGMAAFLISWFVTLFLLSGICAWLYAAVRSSRGPGPQTALKIGVFMGFATGFPLSLSITNWAPIARSVPLGWLIDVWVGAILATFVAALLYKEKGESAD